MITTNRVRNLLSAPSGATGPAARLGLVAALALAASHALIFWGFTVDDAFISFRYARHLVQGLGLVFNPGEPVEGYTNFLWTLIMAAPLALRLDPEVTAKVLGLAANLATVALVYRLGRRGAEGGPLRALPACFLLAANGAFAVAAINGLETAFFTFLVTWGAVRVIAVTDGKDVEEKLPSSAVLPVPRSLFLGPISLFRSPALPWALAALTRPEGTVLFALSLVLVVLYRGQWRRGLRWVAVFAAIYLPHFAWRWWYYGYPFPNTYYAKTGAGLAQYYKGLLDLQDFALTYHGGVFLLALMLLSWRRPPWRTFYLAGLAIGIIYISIYEGGDWIPFYRLLVPALPFYYLVIQEAGLAVASRPPAARLPGFLASRLARHAVSAAVGVGLAALLIATAWPTPSLRGVTERRAVEANVVHAALGRWLKEHAQGRVALMDIGRIGYLSELPLLDTSGLTDPYIAHSPGGLIDKRFDFAYVLARSPQYVVLASTTDFLNRGTPPTDFPIEGRLFADPRFPLTYGHLFTLGQAWEPGGKGYFLAVFARRSP